MSTDTESRGSPTQKEKDPLADCPMPRLSALTPVKAGLMIKEGHAFRTWKKRLCVLEGRYLYYYVPDEDKVPRGVVALAGCTVQEEPLLGKERNTCCFSVVAQRSWNINSKRAFSERRYFFTIGSVQEMNEWMALFAAAATDQPPLITAPPF